MLCKVLSLLLAVAPLLGAASRKKASQLPEIRATVAPTVTVPVEPLGFSAPGEFFLGLRNSLVSLDFLDEDRLLFTFRIPGLLHRDPRSGGEHGSERKIRAVVLDLPQGTVRSEAVWTLRDRKRYLWMLGGGQFLLRDRDELKVGDADLQIKPFLRFPGPVLWLEMDPERKYVITGSSEPPTSASRAGDVPRAGPAEADLASEGGSTGSEPDLILRILERSSGKVMLVSHIRSAVHLPMNADGYLETLRGNGKTWMLNLNYFAGGSRMVGSVESVCMPTLNFVSAVHFLATTCGDDGGPRVEAMTTSGQRLWGTTGGDMVWPVLTVGGEGLRFARETLMVDHGVNAFAPLGTDDIKGQDVQVFEAATGKVVLRAQASPVFDAGGNVAISPSGRKVAILMSQGIAVFDLPAPPPLPPDTKGQKSGKP